MVKLFAVFLLALIAPFMSAQSAGFFGQNYSTSTPCTLPYNYNPSGSGSLPSCWAQSTETGLVNLVVSSGEITAASAGNAAALETGTGSTTPQSIQATFIFSGSNHSALLIHSTADRSTNYTWAPIDNVVYSIVGGTATPLTGATCPFPSSGDVLKFGYSGTTLTCTDITTSASASFTTTTILSGFAGLVVGTSSNANGFTNVTVN